MFIDSHAHLDDPRFDSDRDDTLLRARAAGIDRILTIGNGRGPDDMGCGIPFADSHNWVYTSVGVHPHDAARVEERHYSQMTDLAGHSRVVAIGETGLDYHYDNAPHETQRAVFRRELEIAEKTGLPVIVHTRDADADTEAILKEFSGVRGVLHCFTSGRGLADFAIAAGWMISFSGIVTFRNAQPLLEIARSVPPDSFLIETDCPYLAPMPHRGKRNEPAFVADTAQFLAGVRGVSLSQLARDTTCNFERLFSLNETS